MVAAGKAIESLDDVRLRGAVVRFFSLEDAGMELVAARRHPGIVEGLVGRAPVMPKVRPSRAPPRPPTARGEHLAIDEGSTSVTCAELR